MERATDIFTGFCPGAIVYGAIICAGFWLLQLVTRPKKSGRIATISTSAPHDQRDTRQLTDRVVVHGGYMWRDAAGRVRQDRSGEYLTLDGYVLGEPGRTYPDNMPVIYPRADGCYEVPGVTLNGVELGGGVYAPEYFNQYTEDN